MFNTLLILFICEFIFIAVAITSYLLYFHTHNNTWKAIFLMSEGLTMSCGMILLILIYVTLKP